MDSLTGRRRRTSSEQPTSFSSSSIPTPATKEFIPDLYKSMRNQKRFRSEQPENEEERQLIQSLPCDTESALLHLRSLFPLEAFKGRLPPILLYSQLSAILINQSIIDTQLSKLAKENRILTFSTFTSSNYHIVFLEDFIGIEREGVFDRFVKTVVSESEEDKEGEEDVMGVKRSLENSKYFSKDGLRRKWKFEEDEIRQLVNAGYLGIQEGGMYCISLPGAGKFTKMFEKGRKAVLGAIRRAKFGEILQTELEKRPMKKMAPLGVKYHIYDLIGSGEIDKVDTTSGSLLRVKRRLHQET